MELFKTVGGAKWLIDWIVYYANAQSKNLNAEMSTNVTFLHGLGETPPSSCKPPNLTNAGVAKHRVGGANLKVGEEAAPPTV